MSEQHLAGCHRPRGRHTNRLALLALPTLAACMGPMVTVVRLSSEEKQRLATKVPVFAVGDAPAGVYAPAGPIAATSCKNKIWDPAATEDDAKAQLRFRAVQAGADAVIDVVCSSDSTSVATNCWSSVACQGSLARASRTPADGTATAGNGERKPSPAAPSAGSGFFVNDRGAVITNEHAVNGCSSLSVNVRGEFFPARLIAADAVNDLAVLQVAAISPSPALRLRATPPRLAEPVVALGFPLPGLLAPTVGASLGAVSALGGLQGDTRFIQISAPVQPGNSGGPVIDTSGAVVGVVVSKLNALRVATSTGDIPQNVNFAIGLRTVQSFLDARGVAFMTGDGPGKDQAAAAQHASAATVQVLCAGAATPP
jgi:S1-C subfamily serine protease